MSAACIINISYIHSNMIKFIGTMMSVIRAPRGSLTRQGAYIRHSMRFCVVHLDGAGDELRIAFLLLLA